MSASQQMYRALVAFEVQVPYFCSIMFLTMLAMPGMNCTDIVEACFCFRVQRSSFFGQKEVFLCNDFLRSLTVSPVLLKSSTISLSSRSWNSTLLLQVVFLMISQKTFVIS